MNEEKELTKADWVLAKSLVRSWLMEKGVALTGVNGEASRSSIHRFKLDIEQRIVNTLTTARREAREEAFKDAGLTDREVTRIGSQIVGDVLAQMGVRGTREERHGADTIAAAWVARIVQRITEERTAAPEAATKKGDTDG